MRHWAVGILLVCLDSASVSAADVDTISLAKRSIYNDLVGKLQAGTTDISYLDLRLAYPFTEKYDPYGMAANGSIEETWKAMRVGDCKNAIAQSDKVLEINFVSIPIHFMRADCLKKIGDYQKAQIENAIGRGLGDAVLASGDAKTLETAIMVVTLDEENFVLVNEGIAKHSQALLHHDGHMYDQIDGIVKETGTQASRFFNIDNLMKGMERELGSGK